MNAISFEQRGVVARVSRTPTGWTIDTHGPHGARHHDLRSAGEAAEMAIVLRDQGGWRLAFSPAAEVVRRLVDDLNEGDAHA